MSLASAGKAGAEDIRSQKTGLLSILPLFGDAGGVSHGEVTMRNLTTRILMSAIAFGMISSSALAHSGHEPGALGQAHQTLHMFGGLDTLSMMALAGLAVVGAVIVARNRSK